MNKVSEALNVVLIDLPEEIVNIIYEYHKSIEWDFKNSHSSIFKVANILHCINPLGFGWHLIISKLTDGYYFLSSVGHIYCSNNDKMVSKSGKNDELQIVLDKNSGFITFFRNDEKLCTYPYDNNKLLFPFVSFLDSGICEII